MNVARGDVVLLDFPFSDGRRSKVRPALVVQNERDNRRLASSIVVMITSHTGRATTEVTQVLVDVATPEGTQTGLLVDSAVNCVNVFTVDKRRLVRVIGAFPASLMLRVDLNSRARISNIK